MNKELEEQNKKMVEYLASSGYITSKKVKEAFLRVPRHLFVPKKYLDSSYIDTPLPLDRESTISAFHMVAMMTELLDVKKGQKILEVGAGSGWQACILGYLVGEKGLVVTIEINKKVYEFAKRNVKRLKFKNVKIIFGDGSLGYPEFAPYDRILVTAACPFSIPKPLVEQLKENGKLVAPIEREFGEQELILLRKIKGRVEMERIIGVAFVRLKGKYGFR